MAAETSGPIAIPAMQISGINTKVATPANIPTPIIVLELNAAPELTVAWDRRFESGFLQRRVCEPSVPQQRIG
jgi:hypothetical protein